MFMVFLSGVIGTIFGFLASNYFQHKSQSAPDSTIQRLNALSDEEFLSVYPAEKHHLSLSEQALGDRLYACLSRPQKTNAYSNKSSANKQEAIAAKPEAEQSRQEQDTSSDDFSILARAGTSTAPRQVPGAKLLRIFQNSRFVLKNEDVNGIENALIADAQEFLKNKGCNNPNFMAITDERKSRSKFFDFVKENSFAGTTTVTVTGTSMGPKKLNTRIEFDSPKHEGFDYIEVMDEKKNYLEKRIIKSEEADEAWRYNSCAPSVVLVSDKCPWNNGYVYEFKNFYLSPDSKKLVGDVYCKNPSDKQWTSVGIFDLKQVERD